MKKQQTPRLYILLLIATAILFFNLWSWGVTETSEARYAEIAREMYKSGDFIHPQLLNIGHYHKPPMTYWITAAAFHLFGVNVFAARFFLQIAVLVQLVLVYEIAQLLFENNKTALFSACIYFSFPALIISTRALTTDLYLTTTVLTSIYSWIFYRKKNKLQGLYLFYLSLGIGFLIKGPVIFIVPIVVVIFYNRLIPSKSSNTLHHTLGLILLSTISLTWFINLYIENKNFLDYFIFEHTIDRFSTNSFGRSQPFWFYLVIVPITAFPWFLMLLKPILVTRKLKFNALHLLLLWVFIPLLFFSLSTSKLILYVLPIYSGIALGAAHIWNQTLVNHKKWNVTFIIFAVFVTVALLLAPQFDQQLNFNVWMYALLGINLLTLSWFISFFKKIDKKLSLVVTSVIFTTVLTLFSTFFFKENSELVNDQKNLAQYIEKMRNINQIYVYNERLPSLAFHLNKSIISVNDGDKSLMRETQFENNNNWKKYLISIEDFCDLQLKNAVVIIEADKNISPKLEELLKQYKIQTKIDGWLIFIKP